LCPSPALAGLTFGGEASVRLQDWITGITPKNNVDWQYRLNLRAAADLGEGYYFKALFTNESSNNDGWKTVGYGNTETYNLQVSQCYFGHRSSQDHYVVGRLPFNGGDNPICDLILYPTQPLNSPVSLVNRIFGANYGFKAGNGDLNASFVVLDNNGAGNTAASGDGLLHDGYAIHATYKFNIGEVTFDPQVITVLTKTDVFTATQSPYGNSAFPIHYGFRPVSYGTNISFPAESIKITAGGFFTRGCGKTPAGAPTTLSINEEAINISSLYGGNVDYFGDLFRIKVESGPLTVWYDHNSTTDKSSGTPYLYTNNFIWAQYKINLYHSAKGSFTIQPTLRYLSSKESIADVAKPDNTLLLPELWATMTF